MLKLFQKNFPFFLPYFIFLLIGGIIQFVFSKTEIFFFINRNYHSLADYFFQYLTHIGDGIFCVAVIIFLAAFSFRKALIATCCFIVSSLFLQLLKRLVFEDALRPKAFFENSEFTLRIIDGLVIHSNNSFPSGHTTTAFSIFCILSILFKNKQLGYLWFILAFMAGYSRMYLSQHFFEDVYFGSLLGVITTVLIYYWLTIVLNKNHKEWYTKGWMDYVNKRA